MSPIVALNSVAALASLALGYIVLRGSRGAKPFAVLSFATFLWISVNVYFLITNSLLALRSAYAFGLLVPLSIIYWVDTYFETARSKIVFWLRSVVTYSIGLLAAVVAQFTDIIVKTTAISEKQGSLFFVYSVVVAFLIVSPILNLLIARKNQSDTAKKQIKIIMVGFVAFGLSAILVDVVIPAFGYPQVALLGLDSASSLFLIVAIAYAITKRGLFNIKVAFTEVAVAVLVGVNTVEFLTSQTTSDYWVRGAVLLLISIFSILLVRSVKNEIDRREEVEKLAGEKTSALAELEQRNKNLATLQKVSEIVMNETDMKQMTQHILDEFPKQMDDCIGALLNVVNENRLIPYTFTENNLTKKVHGVIGNDLEKYGQPLQKGFNLLHDSLLDKKQLQTDSLADFISPPIPKPIAMTLQRLIGAKTFVAMPLYAGGEPFGVMLFVFSATAGSVHENNLGIAKSIADEMSLGVQRAQAFQKLKEANEYLQQLDKMKDEFISMASHELNTPLAAIEGYLSMILDEGMGKVDAKSKEYLTRAYDSSKRLAALILDLLNVSRIEQGRLKMKFAQSSMIDLAESVIKELQIKSDAKKIYLKVEGDKKTLPLTWCDPDRIRQVLVNLAGNAIKFTEKGGVTIKVTSDKDFVHVAVTDTGRGIAAEDQKLLFGKFSQVKRDVDEHQGTGLGLYISKNYIELHQGKIWVESEAGKGASFKFDLPVLDKPPVEVKGAVLENSPINAPQIELRNDKEIPQIITDSSKPVESSPMSVAAKHVAQPAKKPA